MLTIINWSLTTDYCLYMTHLIDLKEFTLGEMEQLMADWGQPAFRGRQLFKWLYKGVNDFQEMTDIARSFREELAQKAVIGQLRVEQEQKTADGVRKFLFALADDNLVESVLIPEEGHATLCLSTQVGCAQGCRFCLTARRGLVRHLTAGEIVGQVMAVRQAISTGPPLTNLVFMGMGEPLANFDQLVKALIHHQRALGTQLLVPAPHRVHRGAGPPDPPPGPGGPGQPHRLPQRPG